MVTQELIDYLKEYYPNKLPTGDLNTNQLSFLQGQQSVIQRLEQLLDEEYVRTPLNA